METDDTKTKDLMPDTVIPKKNDELFTSETNSAVNTQQSPNFVKGVSGWRLNSNGIIEAVGVELAGQFNPTNVITVLYGGTGGQSFTGILKGNGTNAFTTITPKSGSGSFYVAASSGGSPTVKVDYTDGIITAIT